MFNTYNEHFNITTYTSNYGVIRSIYGKPIEELENVCVYEISYDTYLDRLETLGYDFDEEIESYLVYKGKGMIPGFNYYTYFEIYIDNMGIPMIYVSVTNHKKEMIEEHTGLIYNVAIKYIVMFFEFEYNVKSLYYDELFKTYKVDIFDTQEVNNHDT